MKLRVYLIAVTIAMTSMFSNVSAQNEKEDESNITKLQQIKISHDMKDLVTLEYVDAFAEGLWKMKVRVYNESGELLYSHVLRKKGDAKFGYDISQFPAGNYTFKLFKNRESIYSKIIMKQPSIANEAKESYVIGQEESIN